MEWQANGITPRILMPITQTKYIIERVIYRYEDKFDRYRAEDVKQVIINAVANYFGVSFKMAQIRMLDLDYIDYEGIQPYVNDVRVGCYSFNSTSKENLQTFSISKEDIIRQYNTNEQFRKVMDSGKFLHIDGFVVLANSKYVMSSIHNEPVLTPYAKKNIDECCLRFDLVIDTRARDASALHLIPGYLNPHQNLSPSLNPSLDPGFNPSSSLNINPSSRFSFGRNTDTDPNPNFNPNSASTSNSNPSPTFNTNTNRNHPSAMFKDATIDLRRVPFYRQDNHNMALFNQSEEMRKYYYEITSEITFAYETEQSFCQLAWMIIQQKRMNKQIFLNKTLLSPSVYDRIKNNSFVANPKIETVMSICIGLSLSGSQSERLLEKAGHKLNDSPLHVVYKSFLSTLRGRTIYEYNEILGGFGLPLLSKKALVVV